MSHNLRIQKFIASSRDEVFKYFTKPSYLEKWSYPTGTTLLVSFFEAKKNGTYHYEHTTPDGVYVCTGTLKEFIPDEKLITVDTVMNPQGLVIFKNLVGEFSFRDAHGGTEVFINQSGFPDEASLLESQRSWDQCLDNLSGLFDGRLVPIASQGHVDDQTYKET